MNAVSKSRAQDRITEERLDWKQNDEDSTRESGRVSFGMRGQATERSPETETEQSSIVSFSKRGQTEKAMAQILSVERGQYTLLAIMYTQ